MNKSEEKQVIVELTNGQKVRGTLVQVDKINLKMILENVKQEVNGKEETIDKLEIKKSDIKELKLVHFEMKAEEKQNINAIPENKIPQNQENTQKAYDKNESFFDKLTSMTHPEAKQESNNYNQKNKDTFNLIEDKNNQIFKKNNYYNNSRGRGNKNHNNRGRGNYNNNRGRGNYNNPRGRGNYNNNRGRGNYNNNRGRGNYNNNRGNYNNYRGNNNRGNQRGNYGNYRGRFIRRGNYENFRREDEDYRGFKGGNRYNY